MKRIMSIITLAWIAGVMPVHLLAQSPAIIKVEARSISENKIVFIVDYSIPKNKDFSLTINASENSPIFVGKKGKKIEPYSKNYPYVLRRENFNHLINDTLKLVGNFSEKTFIIKAKLEAINDKFVHYEKQDSTLSVVMLKK